jgi:hypothetical protein
MTVHQQTQRLPYPNLRPLLIPALLAIIVVGALVATISAGVLAVVVIRQRIAVPIAAAPAEPVATPVKVANAVPPVAASSVEWSARSFDLFVQAILVDEPDNLRLLATSGMRDEAIIVSNDGGQTWSIRPLTDQEQRIVVIPNNGNPPLARKWSGWASLKPLLPKEPPLSWGIWISQEDDNVFVAITQEYLDYALGGGQKAWSWLFLSRDGGKTWQSVNMPRDSIVVDAVAIQGNRLYVASGKQLWQAEK